MLLGHMVMGKFSETKDQSVKADLDVLSPLIHNSSEKKMYIYNKH